MSWKPNPALDKNYRLKFRQKDRTSQAMADATNINNIVSTFLKTGSLPVTTRVAQYGDATALPYLQQALGDAQRARQLYALLPAQVRQETGGDYRRLEPWLRDPRNTDLAVKLGLLTKTEKSPPAPAIPPPSSSKPADPPSPPKANPVPPTP